METLRLLTDLARQYGGTLGLVATWGGIGWVYRRKRADWARKQFLHQVNFSLTYAVDGLLTMRTLLETSAHQVWLNDLGVNKVQAAAAKTTPDQPFVTLADPDDMAFVHRAVLNVLSEKFADAYLSQAMGLPVRCETYWFAVTCERFADIRTLKIRVLLARDHDLRVTFAPGSGVEVPGEYYVPRLDTLRKMHKLLAADGRPHHDWGGRTAVPLGRVVLGLRA